MNVLKAMATAVFVLVMASGCQSLGVYKMDVAQGTPVTKAQASRLSIGMTREQVLYVLGSPAISDTLNPNRWDYLYDYKAGTDGRRQGKADVSDASHYLSIYFDANERVARIDGLATLPK